MALLLAAIAIAAAAPSGAVNGRATTETTGHTATVQADLLASLQAAAPDADPAVLEKALEARTCALSQGLVSGSRRLAVIDYSRPSTQPRLWVFDLTDRRLLFAEHVAHGRGSGDNQARVFSNTDGSHASSLGCSRPPKPISAAMAIRCALTGWSPASTIAPATGRS